MSRAFVEVTHESKFPRSAVRASAGFVMRAPLVSLLDGAGMLWVEGSDSSGENVSVPSDSCSEVEPLFAKD